MDKEDQCNKRKLKIEYKVKFLDYLKFIIKLEYKIYLIAYVFLITLSFYTRKDLETSIINNTIYFLFIMVCDYLYQKWRYKKDKLLQQESTMKIDDEKIIENDGSSITTLGIKDIYKFKEDNTSYYIFTTSFKAWVLPKRYMSKKEHEIFKEIISENYKKSIKFRKINEYKEKEKKEYNGFRIFLLIFHWMLIAITILADIVLFSMYTSDSIGYYPLYITKVRYISYMSYILPLSIASIVLRNNWNKS